MVHPMYETLLDYVENRLPEAEQARIERHLSRPCEVCVEKVGRLSMFMDVTARDQTVAPPPDVLKQAIAAGSQKRGVAGTLSGRLKWRERRKDQLRKAVKEERIRPERMSRSRNEPANYVIRVRQSLTMANARPYAGATRSCGSRSWDTLSRLVRRLNPVEVSTHSPSYAGRPVAPKRSRGILPRANRLAKKI